MWYNIHMKNITKAQLVLEHIAKYPDGLTLKQIQTFILVMNGAQKWLNKGYLKVSNAPDSYLGFERTKEGRGYWTDYLYGISSWGEVGFLHTHCTKLPSGKWKVTEPIVGPFRGKKTKSLEWNDDRGRGAYLRYTESRPKCSNCGKAMLAGYEFSHDKLAHITQWSGAYHIDCKDRVWRVEKVEYRAKANQLTKMTRENVLMASEMSRKLIQNYDEQVQMVWNILGENLA